MDDNTDIGTASTLPVRVEIPGYRLRRQVGSDSIGLWFDAEQESLGRKVTLKILKPKYEENERARAEFIAEMDRLAKLDHPCLIRAIDSLRGDVLALVTERIGTKTVEEALRNERKFAPAKAFLYMRSVAKALDYLAKKGMAHKNVAARYVVLREDGGSRLVTFRNVVPAASWAQLRGRLIQDPHYVAPEQLGGEAPINEKAHVYQVAAMLFHLLAGQPPHTGDDPKEIAKAHFTEDFPSIKRFQPFLKGVPDLMAACTQKDPSKRPTLAELAEALQLLSDDKDPGIAPPEEKNTAPKPRRRRRRRF